MTDARLQAACGEARALGLRSIVHAHSAESMRLAALAGCTQVEHGVFATPEVLTLLAERGTYFDPQCELVFRNYLDNKPWFEGIGNYNAEGFAAMERVIPQRKLLGQRWLSTPRLKVVYGTDALLAAHRDRPPERRRAGGGLDVGHRRAAHRADGRRLGGAGGRWVSAAVDCGDAGAVGRPPPGLTFIPAPMLADWSTSRPARAVLLAAVALASASFPTTAVAQPPASRSGAAVGAEGDFVMRDFRFTDGSVLPALRIHYTTLGRPRRDAAGRVRNAVLILHGTTGSGRGFLAPSFAGELFGPGQPLDTATHYIILPDGIGTGGSSKPSDGLRARFPRYGYENMVTAQHRLVTEGLGVDHLRLVMGTSMGGMQTWMWGVRYPRFMDALVPLASVPTQIAGRNRMMRTMISDAIRTDPEWRGGDYTAPPRGLVAALGMLFMMTSSPLQLHAVAPTRDSADAYIRRWTRTRLATTDANDFLFQFEASRDYDPSPHLGRIRAPVLAINSADDLVNPPELGLMERLIARVPRGRYVLIPTGPRTRGHGTHSLPALWKSHLAALLSEIARPAR